MKLTLSDKVYNALKWIVIILLPAICTLLIALQAAWGWDIPIEAIAATFSAIEVFLGAILGISCMSYNKGGKK